MTPALFMIPAVSKSVIGEVMLSVALLVPQVKVPDGTLTVAVNFCGCVRARSLNIGERAVCRVDAARIGIAKGAGTQKQRNQ